MATKLKQDDDKVSKRKKRVTRTRTVIPKPKGKAKKDKALPKVNVPLLHRWQVLRKR